MDFILHKKQRISVIFEEQESEAVKIAAGNLEKDLMKTAEIVCDAEEEEKIIIGSLDRSWRIKEYVKPCELQDEEGNFRKEAYLLKVVGGKLIIAGSDRRGTVYGIYEFCERIGVSPWYYWADVPVHKKERIFLPGDFYRMDYPSVEYRGIFINDEEELEHWVKLHMGEETIGVHTYEKIFELLLRLKGNYIWPAMHVNSFNMKAENGALADRMGIIVGTSHCDMLMRSNNREWRPWLAKKGYENVKYDYSIEGRNREILKEYWRESVEQNRDFEVTYTLGMRGIHDSGFETSMLSASTEEEMLEKKIGLLQMIIRDQRELLQETLKDGAYREPLQLFVPYKEVLPLYDHGLQVPEDMTVIWSNDNYGYVRRYPSEEERKRKGGHGIYYHNSYWAPPGASYLFICSIPLAQTKYELEKAYENGIRRLWVMNVGAMKPLEQEIEFYLRLAWETGKKDGPEKRTGDVDQYLEGWIDRNFSGGFGKETAAILNDFSQITNTRKIENLEEDVFSQTAYGDEGAERLYRLRDLYQRGNRIYAALPEEEKAAFFQMVLMKIHASYLTNAMFYLADRSTLCVKQGKMQAAARYTEYCRRFDDLRRKMLFYYNEKMQDGKWEGMVTPEDFPPPRTAMHPACTPPLYIGTREMLVFCQNGSDVQYDPAEKGAQGLIFRRPGSKWIEVANGGEGRFDYTVEGPEWVALSKDRGSVETEERIFVTVEDCGEDREGELLIRDLTSGTLKTVAVRTEAVSAKVRSNPAGADAGAAGICAEEDGAVALAADLQPKAPLPCGFRRIRRLGRGGGNLVEAYTAGSVISYPFFLVSEGDVLLELHRYPSLNSVGRIRIECAVDSGQYQVIESLSNDERRGTWGTNIMDQADKLYLKLPCLSRGLHSLHFRAMDRYFAWSKTVLYTAERRANSLGPVWGAQPLVDEEMLREAESQWYADIALKPRPVVYGQMQLSGDSLTVTGETVQAERYADPIAVEELLSLGREPYREKDGDIRIDAFGAYLNTSCAYTSGGNWQYLSSESYGRSGLALYLRQKGLQWKEACGAPALHYRVACDGGDYTLWILSRVVDTKQAGFGLFVDGKEIPGETLYRRGNLWRYEAEQIWRWTPVSNLRLEKGEHILSLAVLSSRLRIDRLYLAAGDKKPPLDTDWRRSV